jgi:hypothetical protein
MMVHPSIERVLYGERGIVVGIEACVKAQCVLSALTLVYSAIDAMAGLSRPLKRKENNGDDFTSWVKAYYLPSLPANVSAEDLWGARCGIVHTYGPYSRHARSGKARMLIYRWRVGHRPDDAVLHEYEQMSNVTVVEIERLVDAFHQAVERFSTHIDAAADLRRRVEHHVKELLCYEPWKPVTIAAAF